MPPSACSWCWAVRTTAQHTDALHNSTAHTVTPLCPQLVLGGHDHHYEITRSEPHGTLVFKSGTDFREFSVLRVAVPPSLAGGGVSGGVGGWAGGLRVAVPPSLAGGGWLGGLLRHAFHVRLHPSSCAYGGTGVDLHDAFGG